MPSLTSPPDRLKPVLLGGCLCPQPLYAHFPALKRQARVDLPHGDALIHWANESAEIAADAFVFNDARNVHAHSIRILLAVPRGRVGRDALVRAIFAGDV